MQAAWNICPLCLRLRALIGETLYWEWQVEMKLITLVSQKDSKRWEYRMGKFGARWEEEDAGGCLGEKPGVWWLILGGRLGGVTSVVVFESIQPCVQVHVCSGGPQGEEEGRITEVRGRGGQQARRKSRERKDHRSHRSCDACGFARRVWKRRRLGKWDRRQVGFGFKTLVIRNESALGWDSEDLRSIDSSPTSSVIWARPFSSLGPTRRFYWDYSFFRNSLWETVTPGVSREEGALMAVKDTPVHPWPAGLRYHQFSVKDHMAPSPSWSLSFCSFPRRSQSGLLSFIFFLNRK